MVTTGIIEWTNLTSSQWKWTTFEQQRA